MIHKLNFTNSDLNVDYQLEYAHNLNDEDLTNPSWKDENGIYRSVGDLFQVVDANNIILSCNGEVIGTQTLYFEYAGAGVSTMGRRLFEQTTETNPETTYRLAIGKPNTPTVNITLRSFIDLLLDTLRFLKKDNDLSDLTSAATARGNLSVYSQAQITAFLANKASLYQAGSGAVIGINNTSIYKPTSNYNPAMLRDVKNLGLKLIWLASIIDGSPPIIYNQFINSDVLDSADFSITKPSSGKYVITHNLGSTAYYLIVTAIGSVSSAIGIGTCVKDNNWFSVNGTNNTSFEVFMFQLNSFTT